MKPSHYRAWPFAAALLAVTICSAGKLQAQDRPVTLSEILASARENNADLQALRGEQGVVEAARLRAGLRGNPVLELEASTGALTGSPEESTLSIGVSREFLTGGKRAKRLAVAEIELERFAARVKEQERLTLLEVKLGYYDLLLAQARMDLAQKSFLLSDQLLQVTRERLAAGDIAELEVNLARVEAGRAAGARIETERDLVSARQRLLALVGAAPGESLNLAAPPEPKPLGADLADLKGLALKHRPDLQLAQREKAQGEAELQLAQAEGVPNVTAALGISRESSLTSLGALEEKETDYLIGLKLSIPIPYFDRNQAGIKEAQSRASSALRRQSLLRRSIELEVETAQARLAASERALSLYQKEIIPQVRENLALLQEAYRLGEMGIQALIEEQKKFQEVNESHLLAEHQRNSALARLEAALGLESNGIDGGKK